MTDTTGTKGQVLGNIAGLGGGLVGVAVSRYVGLSAVIPLAGTLFIGFLLFKLVPSRKSVGPLVAVIAGHWVWMAVGAVVGGGISDVALDLVLMLGAMAWLLARPSKAGLIAIGALQTLACIYNVVVLFEQPLGSSMHKALTVHALLRLVAVGLVMLAWRRIKPGAGSALPEDVLVANVDPPVL